MAELTEKQAARLAGVKRGQRVSSALGLALALLGAAYAVWAIKTFDPRADPREQPRWDRPVAALADLYGPYRPILNAIRPQTDVEQMLHEGVKRNLAFSTGVMILLLRVMIGSLVCIAGLAALTVVVERRRLLELIYQLEGDG